ncbi:SPOR domain-containing protein [Ramlibacter sp. USB13]|uniref:SPOR domain-containing protein n=1 Tax=Ramlibacter cellulosilyticus TaxID=2764187 RepID=A0A923SCL5_9BURK|nr:SPOR domain-containing protein [Ramlibacter cellulosilyticus]MBC5784393.1 SPOR domain-containing protein [Ramlibacter cellulosilyticus]
MALFKSRKKKVDEPVAAASPAESIEVMRRRARHRLIGAVVLVLAGVIGFPLLFDTQPRPVAVDIPIEIPDRNKAKPLPPLPQQPVASGKVSAAPAASAPAASVAAAASTPVITETREEAGVPAQKTEAKPAPAEKVAKAEPAEKKAEPKPDPKAEARVAEAAKARALLEGKPVSTADDASGTRYVVQVGAFAEKGKAREAQQKLERAGLKNYTNVAETKNGTRIRVRAGPFASRAEADKAAEKIKGLDLPAAILTL